MKHGEFLKVDFVGKVAATGEVFDFTLEEMAKSQGMHNPNHPYVPTLIIIGAHMVIPGVESELVKMKAGDEKTFTVSPEDAFGPRDPHFVKLFPLSAFMKQNVSPSPGERIQIEGRIGKVLTSSGGRVRVDFNHPLAGKELEYWVKIVSLVAGTKNKVDELLSYYQVPVAYEVKDDILIVSSDKEMIPQIKTFIQESVTKWVKEIKDIQFPKK